MTIQHLYPTTRPSLDLNFARTKRLDPRVTFTRGSTATYVGSDGLIKTAASNTARFDHDPVTGESLGLLVEESRTNYFTNSSLPTGTVNGVKTTVSGYLLPDGTTGNCTQLYVNQKQANLYDGFNGSVPANTQFHFSFWVQNISGFPVTFSYGRASVVPVTIPNDGKWYKLSGDAGSSNAVAQLYNFFYVDTRPATSTNPVSTPFTVLLWGSQMEAGTFPTSYIPTSGSTVTRAADVASMTGSNFTNFFNNQEGTLAFEYRLVPSGFSVPNRMLVAFADAIDSYGDVIGMWGSGSVRYIDTVGNNNSSGTRWADSSLVYTPPSMNKYAIGYKVGTGTSNFAFNGVLQGARNTVATSVNGLFMGGGPKNYISRLTYYPTRLPDAQLQALTL